jgi:hypothetical protein
VADQFAPSFLSLLGMVPQPVVISADRPQAILLPAVQCHDKKLVPAVPITLLVLHNINLAAKEGYIYYVVDEKLSTILHSVNGAATVITDETEFARLREGDFKEQTKFPRWVLAQAFWNGPRERQSGSEALDVFVGAFAAAPARN